MVATFCNVASGPNTAGYGTRGGAATSTGITACVRRVIKQPSDSLTETGRVWSRHR